VTLGGLDPLAEERLHVGDDVVVLGEALLPVPDAGVQDHQRRAVLGAVLGDAHVRETRRRR
jgi:hypothetical protein